MTFGEVWTAQVAKPLEEKYGWIEIIVELLPVIIELIERCTDNEQEFYALATDPSPFQVRYFERRILRQLRRNRVKVEQRLRFVAYKVVEKTFNVASEMVPSNLGSLYNNLTD